MATENLNVDRQNNIIRAGTGQYTFAFRAADSLAALIETGVVIKEVWVNDDLISNKSLDDPAAAAQLVHHFLGRWTYYSNSASKVVSSQKRLMVGILALNAGETEVLAEAWFDLKFGQAEVAFK